MTDTFGFVFVWALNHTTTGRIVGAHRWPDGTAGRQAAERFVASLPAAVQAQLLVCLVREWHLAATQEQD